MAEEPEIETKELQEAIDELHEEKAERLAEEKKTSWTRYIGLTTAVLAVFAAIGSLRAGSLVNEAQIDQLKASDTWNEYQASKEKGHVYTIQINEMIDAGVTPEVAGPTQVPKGWLKETAGQRIAEYQAEVAKEDGKQKDLSKKAGELSEESSQTFENHEQFAYSVALIQVAIALGAVAALARLKYIWYLSMLCGLAGIGFFVLGFKPVKHPAESTRRPPQSERLGPPGLADRLSDIAALPRAKPG